MVDTLLIPYGQQLDYYFGLTARGTTDVYTSVPLAAGDGMISKDASSFTNLTSALVEIPSGSGQIRATITASEAQCKIVTLRVIDQTVPKVYDDKILTFETYGNVNAAYPDLGWNSSTRTLSDNAITNTTFSSGFVFYATISPTALTNIADSVWTASSRTLTSTSFQAQIPATTISALASAVWSNPTRTLTASAITASTFSSDVQFDTYVDIGTITAIASAVWDAPLSAHLYTGTTGAKLNSGSSSSSGGATAAEIWTYANRSLTAMTSAYTPYTVNANVLTSTPGSLDGGFLNPINADVGAWNVAPMSWNTLFDNSFLTAVGSGAWLSSNSPNRTLTNNVTAIVPSVVNANILSVSPGAIENSAFLDPVYVDVVTWSAPQQPWNTIFDNTFLTAVGSGVWLSANSPNRTLTSSISGGATAAEIWSYSTRSLTQNVTAQLTTSEHNSLVSDNTSAIVGLGYTNTRAGYLDYLDSSISSRFPSSASGAILTGVWNNGTRSLTQGVTAVTNLDKTNYQLAANQDVRNVTGFVAGSVGSVASGVALVPNQDIRNVLGSVTGSVSAIVNPGNIWTTPTVRTLTEYGTGNVAYTVWNYASRTLTDKTGFTLLASEHTTISQNVSSAVVNLGYSQARAAKLDYLDASILSRQASGVISSNAPTTGQIAWAVWEELTSGHVTLGSAGKKLESLAPGASGGSLTAADVWAYSNKSLTNSVSALLLPGTHTGAIIPTVDTVTNPVEFNSNDDLLTVLGYTASGNISNAVWNSPARSITLPVTSVVVQDKTNYQLAANQDIRNVLGNVTGSVSAIINTGTIWTNPTRTLTDYASGQLITNIWNNSSRTLTDKTGFSLLASEHSLISQNVSGGVVNLGYSQARAAKLDYLDASILSRQASGIVSSNAPTTGQIAYAVWEELTSGHTLDGSTGKKLSDLSASASGASAADIWTYANRSVTLPVTAVIVQDKTGYSLNGTTTGFLVSGIWNNSTRTITDKTGFYLAAGEHGSIATDVTSGLTAQGYTSARAANLDRLDVNVSTRLSSGGLVSLSSSERSQIASSVLGYTVETGWTTAETLRVIAAILAGECNITGTDPTYTVTFRDVNDSKNRLVATTDGVGRRLSIVSYDKT